MTARVTADTCPELWLPPEHSRLWKIKKNEKLETPLNPQGLVDLDELVTLGRQTVVDSYDWTSSFNDVHHLQWPAASYRNDDTRHEFRELVSRKAYISRRFHNWLHLIAVPPPIPHEDVIHYSIEAERSARLIAVTSQLAVRLTRMPGIPEAKLIRRLEQEFDNYTVYVENSKEVPLEFRLLKLDDIEAANIDEMLAANRRIGKAALHLIPIRLRKLHMIE